MKKLTALLGLTAITMHNSNIFGTGKNYAKLDEDQLQKIEDALAAEGGPDATIVENLQNELTTAQTAASGMEEAVTAALELNGLQITEGQSAVEAIALLAQTCKEYGASKERGHSKPENNGKEKEEETPETYAFENVLNDMSKYPTLK